MKFSLAGRVGLTVELVVFEAGALVALGLVAFSMVVNLKSQVSISASSVYISKVMCCGRFSPNLMNMPSS